MNFWHTITWHIPVGLSYVALWSLTIISGLLAVTPRIAKWRYGQALLLLTFLILGILGYLSSIHERDENNENEKRHDQIVVSGANKITVVQVGENEILQAMHLPIPGQSALSVRANQVVYISDAYGGDDFTGAVAVYSYPTGKQIETLRDLLEPQGMCTDGHNIFVTSTASHNIFEYGEKDIPKAILDDPGFLPVGCAFNRSTGDLAVTNVISVSGSNGNVAIYTHASGKPFFRQAPGLGRYDFCIYDGSGTLFVDGTGPADGNKVTLAAFDKGEGVGRVISFDQASEAPRGLDGGEVPQRLGWDGKYVTMGSDAIVYRLRIFGNRASVSGRTNLSGSAMNYYVNGPTMFTIEAKEIFAYRYPSGGKPISMFGKNLVEPIAALAVNK